jgi:D-psicose/D-tagatose/L-ribulose 3-epimerase
MLLSLCNEVLREHAFAEQCRIASALGYKGLEIAPFTLTDDPLSLTDTEISRIRGVIEDHDLSVTGLHWLLIAPAGLSITSGDAGTAARTRAVLERLIETCALLGGPVLVHGSPGQRALSQAASPEEGRANALACFEQVAGWAENASVTYCIEPLSKNQTDYINNLAEALELVDAIGSPAFRTMIDAASAGIEEPAGVAGAIREYWPTGKLAHVQINDTNLRAPGQGENRFAPVFQALRDVRYDGIVAVEPFVYEPDGATTAAYAAGYVRGILEDL